MKKTAPSGIILLNKKCGVTSFQALGEIKRALGSGKVGHTGTLDKFACGLLVVLTGRALKLSPWFSACEKQYLGKIYFGRETDTLDPEGNVIAEADLPARESVENVLGQFTGDIMQSPPAYSAIHINGKRASDLARSGKAPEMKQRPVTIYSLELRSWQPPFAEIFVHCSSGTYIRSLARDIALAAGSRAHLVELVRTQVAGFKLGSGEWKAQSGELPLPVTKSVINSLGLPFFEVAPADVQPIIHGKPLEVILQNAAKLPCDDGPAAVFSGDSLVAIVEKSGSKWKYCCVF